MSDDEKDLEKTFLASPLFKSAEHPRPSLETFDEHWRSGAQAIGYREAATTLLDVVLGGDQYASRTLLHPILFLFRHSIELRMKQIIDANQPDRLATIGHDLNKLWIDCKKVIIHYLPDTLLDQLDDLIAELHAIDPDGQTFRYATRRGQHIQIPFDELDLIHLQTKMGELDIAFEGLVTEIDEALTALNEMTR